jgi:hypothetical protein
MALSFFAMGIGERMTTEAGIMIIEGSVMEDD